MSRDPLSIAERMSYIEASGIRKFFDLSQSMKDPINLSIGQADFDPNPEVQEAAIAAIREGKNRYTVTQGIEPLRVGLREKMAKCFPINESDDLIITSGVSGGLMLTYLCTLNPGDEIMIPDPYFVMYKHLARVAGAVPVCYSTFPDFQITRERLNAAYSDKTRALLINSPSNPTGYVYSEEEVKIAAEFAREKNILLISDDIYYEFSYDRKHTSPKLFNDQTLVLGGFSKSYGVPGWRMGYAIGPQAILDQMRVLQQFSFVCAPTPAQWGILAGLDMDFSEHCANYRVKRDIVFDGLKDRFQIVKPEGSFYMFPQLPEGVKDADFVAKCIENNTLVVPGSACSTRDTHFRISFAVDNDTLKRGVDVLNRVLDELV